VRIALLRRLAPATAPGPLQMALADVPILALEIVVAAVAVAIAAPRTLGMSVPLAAAVPAGVACVVVGLRLAHRRAGHHRLVAGLGVLACRRRRGPLASLIAALSALTAVRLAILLAAAGLPAAPADVALLFAVLGGFGVLPIGLAAAPGAALATQGAGHLAAAGALGAAIAGTTVAAVLAYGALALVGAAPGRTRPPRRLASVSHGASDHRPRLLGLRAHRGALAWPVPGLRRVEHPRRGGGARARTRWRARRGGA
jgi:hypothetical protein